MQQPYLKGLSRLDLDELKIARNHFMNKCEALMKHDHFRLGWLFGEIAALTECEIERQENAAKDNFLKLTDIKIEWTGKQDEENSCVVLSLNELLDFPDAEEFPEEEDLK